MKKSKTSYVIVALIVILLAIGVGYAAFSQTLPITGTAVAKGNFDIQFANEQIDSNAEGNSVTLSEGNKEMTINVKLTQPGDSKTVKFNVKNLGSVDAVFDAFNVTNVKGKHKGDATETTVSASGGTFTFGAIKMTITENASTTHGTELPNTTGTLPYIITFEWPSDYDSELDVEDTATFKITLKYDQKV